MLEQPQGYEVVHEVISFRELSAALKENPDLWLFCGTEGWHGTNMSLDRCERILRAEDDEWLPGGAYITVFIIDPKRVSLKWGEIHLKSINEVGFLRQKVTDTVQAILDSQKENVSAMLFA